MALTQREHAARQKAKLEKLGWKFKDGYWTHSRSRTRHTYRTAVIVEQCRGGIKSRTLFHKNDRRKVNA